jgi:hypothetical protein
VDHGSGHRDRRCPHHEVQRDLRAGQPVHRADRRHHRSRGRLGEHRRGRRDHRDRVGAIQTDAQSANDITGVSEASMSTAARVNQSLQAIQELAVKSSELQSLVGRFRY